MKDERRYTVGELARLGGVSRRTVRYYVQEGLIPTPYGVGRGAHYGSEHLERLLQLKSMQEQGMSLEAIRHALLAGKSSAEDAPVLPLVPRTLWIRVKLVPGVELHISSPRRLPPPRKLGELVDWCRRNFGAAGEDEDGKTGV